MASAGRVVGLVEARLLERDAEVEARRDPAVGRRDALDAGDRRGRDRGEPQPAVAGEALLRGEVVDVDLRRGRSAARRRPTSRRRARAGRRPAPSGRWIGSITPVDVSFCGQQYASTAALACGLGCGARAGSRSPRDPRGGVPPSWPAANLDENSPHTRCWLRALDQPERGRVPERGGAAVAEQHLVAVGEGEQLGDAGADAPDHRLHGRLAVAGAEVVAGAGRPARPPPRRGPSTVPSRTDRRTGRSSGGRTMVVGSTAMRRAYASTGTDPPGETGSSPSARSASARSRRTRRGGGHAPTRCSRCRRPCPRAPRGRGAP